MTSDAQRTYCVQSSQYGELEFKEDQVFSFPKGIIGIETVKQYGIMPIAESPFYLLQALEQDTSFIIVSAGKVVQDYEFEISDEVVELLEAKRAEDILVCLIVNIVEDQFYVNLKAPLLLSPQKHLGTQYVIYNQDYPIRQLLQTKESR